MERDRVKEVLGDDKDAAFWVSNGDLHAACMMQAAKALGLQTAVRENRPSPEAPVQLLLHLRWADKAAYFNRGQMVVGGTDASPGECRHINGALSVVVDSKRGLKDLVRVLGFPVSAGTSFGSSDEQAALAWFKDFGRPVCLKPDHGRQGSGVFPGLVTPDEFLRAFGKVASYGERVVAEEYAPGSAVRFFFVRPKVVGIRIDLPANVAGDGVSSVARLIAAKNEEKRLRTGHKPIEIDEDVHDHLTRHGLDLAHVPALGECLFLRDVSNGSKGGDSITSLDAVHPSYIRQIEAMCNAIRGLNLTAVDTKVGNPSVPADPGNYRILELNSNPGVVPYHFPWEGEPQDVCTPIIRLLTSL